jgi:hypothetical protein
MGQVHKRSNTYREAAVMGKGKMAGQEKLRAGWGKNAGRKTPGS